MRHAIPMTAVWLRRIDGHVEVLVELDTAQGPKWSKAITEVWDSQFGHIAEATGRSHWTEEPDLPQNPTGPGA